MAAVARALSPWDNPPNPPPPPSPPPPFPPPPPSPPPNATASSIFGRPEFFQGPPFPPTAPPPSGLFFSFATLGAVTISMVVVSCVFFFAASYFCWVVLPKIEHRQRIRRALREEEEEENRRTDGNVAPRVHLRPVMHSHAVALKPPPARKSSAATVEHVELQPPPYDDEPAFMVVEDLQRRDGEDADQRSVPQPRVGSR